MPFYCYRHGRAIISYSCIYFGRSKFKTIKHYATTVHSYGRKIVLVQLTTHPKQIAIYLYCDSCKNYIRRRAVTILVQNGLLTHGTGQLLLFVLLMPQDFEDELFISVECSLLSEEDTGCSVPLAAITILRLD